MPHYFFHTQTKARVTDTEGLQLTDHAEARVEAIRSAGELMRDGAETFWGTRPWSVTVTDDSGLILLEIQMHGVAAPALSD